MNRIGNPTKPLAELPSKKLLDGGPKGPFISASDYVRASWRAVDTLVFPGDY